MGLRYTLQAPSAAPVSLSNSVYRKDAIRVGRFVARNPFDGSDLTLEVTPDRMKRWLSAYQQMQANGVKVDLTVDHAQGAAAKRGEVVAMQLDGDRLMFDAKPMDADSEQLMQRCPEVSVEIEPNARDGEGRDYGEAITAISICRQPVVPGQQPFVKIAASRSGTPEVTLCYLSADSPSTTDPKGKTAMNEDQLKQLRTELGLDANADAAAILAAVGKTKTAATEATAKVTTLEGEKATLSRQVTELQAKAKPTDEPESVKQMRQQLVEQEAEHIDERVNQLVTLSLVKPDTAELIRKEVLGQPGSRNTVMLSRGTSGTKPAAAGLLGIIERVAKEAPELSKLRGESTGPQTMTLSRSNAGAAKDDPDLTKTMIDQANAGMKPVL